MAGNSENLEGGNWRSVGSAIFAGNAEDPGLDPVRRRPHLPCKRSPGARDRLSFSPREPSGFHLGTPAVRRQLLRPPLQTKLGAFERAPGGSLSADLQYLRRPFQLRLWSLRPPFPGTLAHTLSPLAGFSYPSLLPLAYRELRLFCRPLTVWVRP